MQNLKFNTATFCFLLEVCEYIKVRFSYYSSIHYSVGDKKIIGDPYDFFEDLLWNVYGAKSSFDIQFNFIFEDMKEAGFLCDKKGFKLINLLEHLVKDSAAYNSQNRTFNLFIKWGL